MLESYKDKTLVQMKIHANQQRAVIHMEYGRHLKDAKLANFDQCGCDFCIAVRINSFQP